jgi:hypothetical protein
MSSACSSAGCLPQHEKTLRAYLESHGIDPDAFANLPDDMQSELLQTLPDTFESRSAASVDCETEASTNGGSPSIRELLQEDIQECETDIAQVSRGSSNDADFSHRESIGFESGNSDDLPSDQEWMQRQQVTSRHAPRSGQGRPSPLNSELRDLLECHGIDVDAFADMPDDIQSEILRTIPNLQDSASPASAGSVSDGSADESEHEYTPQLRQHAASPFESGAAASSPQSYQRHTALSLRPSIAAASPPTDSRIIFSMGFDAALVTRALWYKSPFSSR